MTVGWGGTVGWDSAAIVASWPGLPRLADDITADACVVGLGASGLAAVDALLERGLSVVGVDAGRVASGAAGRNGGLLLGGSAAYLNRAIESLGSADAAALYGETLRELDRLIDLVGAPAVRRVGSIRLAGRPGSTGTPDEDEERQRELDDCAAHEVALRTVGIAVERYDGLLGSGLFLPDDAAMNPAARAIRLAGQLSERAALYENSAVRAMSARRVVTDVGSVSAGVVIVAVDGRLEVVLPGLAGRVRTARLQMLCTQPVPSGRLPCPVYARWGYDYAQQDEDGRIFAGGGRDLFADHEWTTDASPTAPVQAYIEQIAKRMAGQPISVTHRWAASVGYTPDGRPLVAEVERGVVACGGYNGTGNLVGPVAARAAVALAVDAVGPPSYFNSSLTTPGSAGPAS